MRYHHTHLLEQLTLQRHHIKCWRGNRATGTPMHCWWACKMDQPLWKTIWEFLIKPNIHVTHDPKIPLLCIYSPKRSEIICPYKDSSAKVHYSFIYKSPKLEMTPPPTNRMNRENCGLLNGTLLINTEDGLLIWASSWRNLKNIASERSQRATAV